MSKVAVLTERNILKEVITVPSDQAVLDPSKRWVPISEASDLHHRVGTMYYDWGNCCFLDVNYHPELDLSENDELIDTILDGITDLYTEVGKPLPDRVAAVVKRRKRP